MHSAIMSGMSEHVSKKIQTIWIDIENTPHVLFFVPIIQSLRASGCRVIVTARACAQTLPLLDAHGIAYHQVGYHFVGRHVVGKGCFVLHRVFLLMRHVWGQSIDCALCHASRSLLLASKLMRIRNICFIDYEHVAMRLIRACADTIVIPEFLPKENFIQRGFHAKKIQQMPGFKEEFYVHAQNPRSLIEKYKVHPEEMIVLLRAPAEKAHYHHRTSEELWKACLCYFQQAHVPARIFVSYRYASQRKDIEPFRYAEGSVRFVVLDNPENGLELLTLADLVISGGGSMLREAVALGIPCYSIFTGKLGALDSHLIQGRRMGLIRNVQDIAQIPLRKKDKMRESEKSKEIESYLMDQILHTAKTYSL